MLALRGPPGQDVVPWNNLRPAGVPPRTSTSRGQPARMGSSPTIRPAVTRAGGFPPPVPNGGTSVSLSTSETDDISRANATGLPPVVFVHGLWMLASSWQPWRTFFEEDGYASIAPRRP